MVMGSPGKKEKFQKEDKGKEGLGARLIAEDRNTQCTYL